MFKNTPLCAHGTVRHCDVLKAEQLGRWLRTQRRRSVVVEQKKDSPGGPIHAQKLRLFTARFPPPLPSNLSFPVLFSRHGVRSYVKAVDGVRGPPQPPVSQAEKVQPTTGDSWHSVPAEMQPPSAGRQPDALDVSSGHRRRTQAHPRYLACFPPFFLPLSLCVVSGWVSWGRGFGWSGELAS